MSVTAITDQIDHNITSEFLTIFNRHAGNAGHGFQIITIHMEDRAAEHLGKVAGVRARTGTIRCRCKTDLVVNDDMNSPANAVTFQFGKHQSFHDQPLPRKGRITMNEHGQYFTAGNVTIDILLPAHFTRDNRVHDFKVGWIRCQGHVNGCADNLAIIGITHMIFHVTRPGGSFGGGRHAVKFRK